MEWGHLLTAVLIAGLCLGVGVVSANEAPLPEAGLDQQVRQGATVYLDAGGSVDPDGQTEDYRWRITAPDGTVTTPDCPTCVETRFRADQSGRYEVTVTVTDDDGAARSDTLFVTVAAATPSPTATPTATPTMTPTPTATPTPTPTATPIPTPTMTVTPTPTPDSSGSQTQPASDGTAVELPSISLPGDIISDILNPDTDTATPEPESVSPTPTPVQTTPSEATGVDSPSDTGAEPPSENTPTPTDTGVDDSPPNNSSTESDSTVESPPSTAPSGGGLPADGTGYYEEIERTSRSQGAGHNYYFNFLNDDQVASNKHAGNSGLGADAGGMGVKKDTLENLAEYNPNVTLVDSDYGETTYKISGQVANNFESDEDVHSGTRVGTTDIITEEDLTQENNEGETQNNLKETNSGTNSGEDSGDNEVVHSRHDSVFNSVDSSSNDTSSTNTDTNSESDYSYNPDSNQVENSRGQCVGWGC